MDELVKEPAEGAQRRRLVAGMDVGGVGAAGDGGVDHVGGEIALGCVWRTVCQAPSKQMTKRFTGALPGTLHGHKISMAEGGVSRASAGRRVGLTNV